MGLNGQVPASLRRPVTYRPPRDSARAAALSAPVSLTQSEILGATRFLLTPKVLIISRGSRSKFFTEDKGCLTCEDQFCLGALHQISQEEDFLSYAVQKCPVLDFPDGPGARNPFARDSMGSVSGLGRFHTMQGN